MAENTRKLSKKVVDGSLPQSKPYRLWDVELKGFGLKVSPKGIKTYFVWYRAGEGRRAPQREYTVARHGEMTPEEARAEAGRVLSRVRLGGDPQAERKRARRDITVSELCDLYLQQGVATKKEATLKTDRSRIRTHIKPLLGKKPAALVSPQDIARFLSDVANGKSAAELRPSRAQLLRVRGELRELGKGKRTELSPDAALLLRRYSMPSNSSSDPAVAPAAALKALRSIDTRRRTDPLGRGGRGTASRTLGLLGAIFTFAVREGVRANNPVSGAEKYRDNQAQRFLAPDELAALAMALRQLEVDGVNRHGLLVIRLLLFTGARKGEIESLRWSEVDLGRGMLRLADSKTGARVILLGAAALECLASINRTPGSPFVFPGEQDLQKHYVGTPRIWAKVKAAAGLPGVRLHDLRHTFASYGAAGGLSLPLIGALLGHRDVKTTSQYAHLADDPLRMAAERTASAIQRAMTGRSGQMIPPRN